MLPQLTHIVTLVKQTFIQSLKPTIKKIDPIFPFFSIVALNFLQASQFSGLRIYMLLLFKKKVKLEGSQINKIK